MTRARDRTRMSEFTTLPDAISRFVRPGDRVALEGFTHLIPFAAGHEFIRQGLTDLTLVRMTPDPCYDQMIGRAARASSSSRGAATPASGSLHRLRDAVEQRLAAPARDRRAQPRRNGERVRRGRGRPAVRAVFGATSAPICAGVNPNITLHHLPVHGRRAGLRCRRCARRHDHPRAEGRPRRQRADRGHHRRAEGGGARREARRS